MTSHFSSNNRNDLEDSDDGSDDIPELLTIPALRQSVLGQIRTCGNVSRIEWSFIALSIISILSGTAFNIYRMVTLPAESDEYVFALVVLVNLTFCVWYLLHGIFQEQPFEILMFVVTSLLLSILITLNYASASESTKETGHLKLVRFLVTLFLTIPNAVLGLKVGWQYWSSGNLIFKTVGGDMRLQRMCRTMFFGMSLLVFDAQAFISCLILVMERGIADLTDEDIIIIVSGVTFTVMWLVMGYTAIRKENMPLVWLFFVTSIIQPIYCVYLIVDGLHEIVEKYSTIRTDSIFVSGSALVLAHFALLATLVVISSNFNKGLRSAVYGYEEIPGATNSGVQSSSSQSNYGTNGTSRGTSNVP